MCNCWRWHLLCAWDKHSHSQSVNALFSVCSGESSGMRVWQKHSEFRSQTPFCEPKSWNQFVLPILGLFFGKVANIHFGGLSLGAENRTRFFLLDLFGHPQDIPAQIPWYSAKTSCRTFWPPTLHVKDPHPTRRYPVPKVWVCPPFFCLKSSGSLVQEWVRKRRLNPPLRLNFFAFPLTIGWEAESSCGARTCFCTDENRYELTLFCESSPLLSALGHTVCLSVSGRWVTCHGRMQDVTGGSGSRMPTQRTQPY